MHIVHIVTFYQHVLNMCRIIAVSLTLTDFFGFVDVGLCDEGLDLLFSFTGAIVEKLFAYLIDDDDVTCFIETCYYS